MLCIKENRHRDGARRGAFLLTTEDEKELGDECTGGKAYKCKAPRCK